MDEPKTYKCLDRPEILQYLFHPRRTAPGRRPRPDRIDYMIPVAENLALGASLHFYGTHAPLVVFFHGNGEIVQDYDDLGPVFTRGAGVNFLVVDYRGYGDSNGVPGVGAMMADGPRVMDFVSAMMAEKGMTGPVSVMGRSLGSAPALALAGARNFHSLIIESGFAFTGPLLRVLGLDPSAMGLGRGMENLEKMGRVHSPCLIIHALGDQLIPFSDGQALYDACPSPNKFLLKIEGAGHNDIFIRGMAPYLEQVKAFCRG